MITPEQIRIAYQRMRARSTERLVRADLGPCLEYDGARNEARGGYAMIRVGNTIQRGHRVAFEAEAGRPIGPGLNVLHRCDNPPCIAYAHLVEGTQADNIADMMTKGRLPGGEHRPNAKLTGPVASAIRLEYLCGATTERALAAKHGMSRSVIHDVIARRIWREVA